MSQPNFKPYYDSIDVIDYAPRKVNITHKKIWDANDHEFVDKTLYSVNVEQFDEYLPDKIKWLTETFGAANPQHVNNRKFYWYISLTKIVMEDNVYTMYQLRWAQ